MKAMLIITLLAAAAALPTPNEQPTDADLDAIDANNDRIIALANDLQKDLETEKAAHAGTTQELDAVLKTKLPQLQAHVDQLTTDVYNDTLTIQKKNNRILKDDILFGIIGLAVVGYAFAKFYLHIPI
jgi:hypothetical protein